MDDVGENGIGDLRIIVRRGGQSDVGGRRHGGDRDGGAELRPRGAVGTIPATEIVAIADNLDIF